MRYIYMVFTATQLKVGKMIRVVTRNKYSHSSISLSPTLEKMYSFARYNKHTALHGGFVEENITRYYETERLAANVKVCQIPVTDEQYEAAIKLLDYYKNNRERFKYNLFAALFMPFNIDFRIKDSFTCIGFTINFFCKIGVLDKKYASRVVSIREAEELFKSYVVYEGKMYKPKSPPDPEDEYFKKQHLGEGVYGTLGQVATLIKRTTSGK